ncbi:unnamed protein product, partial [Mesorhabditis spiculigera]
MRLLHFVLIALLAVFSVSASPFMEDRRPYRQALVRFGRAAPHRSALIRFGKRSDPLMFNPEYLEEADELN